MTGVTQEVANRKAERKSASHGEAGYPRSAFDFYPTEPWVTEALCRAVEFDIRGVIWEPACGDGRMVKVLKRWHTEIVASDLADHGYGERGIDFLAHESVDWLANIHGGAVTSIITNPPFALARRFILKALDVTRSAAGKVAMLQRHEFDAPVSNHPLFAPPFAAKLVLHKRPRWSNEDKASPRFPYAWYLWDHCHEGPPILRYLPDPDKAPQSGRLL